MYEHAVLLQLELVTLLFLFIGIKTCEYKKRKICTSGKCKYQKHEMIQRHSSRCEQKIKLDLQCNGTLMTFFFPFSAEDQQIHWHHTWKALKL